MAVVLLVRHAQASFGAADYDRLSALGHEQSRCLAAALRPRLDRLALAVAGEMRRHKETALPCLDGLAAQLEQERGFNEFDPLEVLSRHNPAHANRLRLLADMARTLQPHKAFAATFTAALERWQGGEHDAEYTETWPAFQGRCLAALQAVAQRLTSGQTALVFTSGGPIGAIAQALLGLSNAQTLALSAGLVNGGVTKIISGGGGMRLCTLNEHSHFEGPQRRLLTYR